MSLTTTPKATIPIARPFVGSEEETAVLEVLRSGWLSQGPRVAEFEKRFAEYVGAKHAIAVSSCTTGLHLALYAAGIGAGDEVLCPSLSFIATANSIRYVGATPIFVDIDPATFNLDPNRLEESITPRTKAILVVHQIGLPAARWLSPDKALIQLSLRHKTDDHLWFAFFHEVAHILLHGKRDFFVDVQDQETMETKEQEANRFVADLLIPRAEWRRFKATPPPFHADAIKLFAFRIGLAPGIVVGRLQHEGLLPRSHCNALKQRFELLAPTIR